MIDVINHSVKIKDVEFLQFLYPNYKIINRPILFADSPVIYVGETRNINKVKALGVDYIIVTELAEYDLTDRLVLLDVVFSKWHRKVPKYLLEFYEDLDDETFMEQVKIMWVTGKWHLKEYDKSGIFLELLMSFKTDTYQITKTYISMLDRISSEYMELSLLTFLNRVTTQRGKVSKWYQKVLDDYKRSKASLIKPALTRYMNSKIKNTELRVFNLILDLNKKY